MKNKFKLFIIGIIFLFLINIVYSCDEGDNQCFQEQFNDNPTSANFQNLANPTSTDYQKIANPTINDFNKLKTPKANDFKNLGKNDRTKEVFDKLDGSQKNSFFTETNTNINDNKDLFQKYLKDDLNIPIEAVKGTVSGYDGTTLTGTNGEIKIQNFEKVKDVTLEIDEGGNIIIKDKNGGTITADNMNVNANSDGTLEIEVTKGTINIENPIILTEGTNIILNAGTTINLGENIVSVEKETTLTVKEFDEKNKFDRKSFLEDSSQRIIYVPNENMIAASGNGIIINYDINGVKETIKLEKEDIYLGEDKDGKNIYETKYANVIVSKNLLDIKGKTLIKINEIEFETNYKDFYQNILTKDEEIINNLKSVNFQQSINFYSEEEKSKELIAMELNIFRENNNNIFFEDANKILNNFIEKEIKTDKKILDNVKDNIAWLKENSVKLGLDSNEKIQTLLRTLENKLTTDDNSLIEVNTIIEGYKEIKEYFENKENQISDELQDEAILRVKELGNNIGEDKTAQFIMKNFPENKNYAINYDIITELGLENYVNIGGSNLVDENTKVFIQTYKNGETNIDIVANQKEFEIKGWDINTEKRVIIGIQVDEKQNQLNAIIDGMEVDTMFGNPDIYAASINLKGYCIETTAINHCGDFS